MDVFIINMPNRPDRLTKMKALMSRVGLSYQVIEPVDPATLPEKDPNGLSRPYRSLNSTLLDRIFNIAKSPVFMVLEDDLMANVHPGSIKASIRNALANLQGRNWHMLYLEYCLERCNGQHVSPQIRLATRPYCTAAIIYNRSACERIRRAVILERKMISFAYSNSIRNGSIKAYLFDPPLFVQDAASTSDMGHTQSPWGLHYWLNMVFKMYPDKPNQHYARLPACLRFTDVVPYVRWYSISRIVLVVAIVLVAMIICFRVELWRPKMQISKVF